ncbi:MAG TPA: protease modulator HflK, partial [Burkholderiales bacterium]|nr:protease modulator HflK [Burkholderiales bacterium]
RMYLETMQDMLSNTNKVLIDQQKSGNLIYLPLDKLVQKGAMSPAPQPQEDAAAKAPQPESDERSRDAFRNREREDRP